MSDDYEVGYRKPPKHTRFKKGRSGNPKGQPRGRKNMSTILKDVLGRKVVVRQDGQERRVPFREAFIHRLVGRALEGNTRDMIALMKAMHDYMPEALKEEREEDHKVTVEFVLPDGTTVKDWLEMEKWEETERAWLDSGLADD